MNANRNSSFSFAHNIMHFIKLVGLTILKMVEQVLFLPRSIIAIVKDRKLRVAQANDETERLDRIRNPSKYRGK
jgi:hypothetical protein